MNENWKEKLAGTTNNSDYVKLSADLMRVSDLNSYLSSFSNNLLTFNKLGEFLYYKRLPGVNYNPSELGKNIMSLGETEQEKEQLGEIFHGSSTDEERELQFSDQANTRAWFMMNRCRAIFDKNHQFAGINESIQDIYPLVEYYSEETGQKLVDDPNNPDSEVCRKDQKIDAESGASEL